MIDVIATLAAFYEHGVAARASAALDLEKMPYVGGGVATGRAPSASAGVSVMRLGFFGVRDVLLAFTLRSCGPFFRRDVECVLARVFAVVQLAPFFFVRRKFRSPRTGANLPAFFLFLAKRLLQPPRGPFALIRTPLFYLLGGKDRVLREYRGSSAFSLFRGALGVQRPCSCVSPVLLLPGNRYAPRAPGVLLALFFFRRASCTLRAFIRGLDCFLFWGTLFSSHAFCSLRSFG